ncbi:MAG: methyltransferase domain-containing protein [Myxococcales bacterium]|nr:methyltransferase domain-containing protein [Myxococcales bacterium]
MGLAHPGHVREQYQDASRLEARVVLYERFAREEEPWYRWLLGQLAPESGERILDVGAGSGGIWRENHEALPSGVRVALLDRSPAMLSDARARGTQADLAVGGHASALPFRDDRFDALLAAHMLYHVRDRAAALRELRRVLRPGGRLCVATNDWTHLIELREFASRFGLGGALFAPGRSADEFDLESAAAEIHAAFGPVRVARRRVQLEITEAAPLVDYVRSVLPASGSGEEADLFESELTGFGREVERYIERSGSFETTASAGVVQARA